ncbi:hypothetical protein K474DRAFT_32988 [Panus rudis PR-1116 ss-1]|nr:hypothetical protein K474DRAFT_32988 [Panus rudis PR-1116 ss-1]
MRSGRVFSCSRSLTGVLLPCLTPHAPSALPLDRLVSALVLLPTLSPPLPLPFSPYLPYPRDLPAPSSWNSIQSPILDIPNLLLPVVKAYYPPLPLRLFLYYYSSLYYRILIRSTRSPPRAYFDLTSLHLTDPTRLTRLTLALIGSLSLSVHLLFVFPLVFLSRLASVISVVPTFTPSPHPVSSLSLRPHLVSSVVSFVFS